MRVFRSILLAMVLASTCVVAAEPPSGAMTSASVASQSDIRRAADLLVPAIGDRRLVMLGELHGTQEAPALAATLLERDAAQKHPTVLALEVSTQEQPRFDRYLASRGTASDRMALLEGAHWRDTHHDGRDSQAMFALIDHVRQLRARGARVALVAFDGGGTDMDSRNRRMAEVLRATAARFPRATLLVLTGNVHAMTRRPPWELVDEHGKRIEPPMSAGGRLTDLAPISVDIRGMSGAYWACIADECGVRTIDGQRPSREPTLMQNAADDAWDVMLMLPRLTPSPPATEELAGRGSSAPHAVNP